MRAAPEFPTDLSISRRPPVWEATFEVQLITRLFGGGAQPRKIDERSWLRPSALKSALRFWWRSAYGHGFPTIEELRIREGELFGSSAVFGPRGEVKGGPGIVRLEVRDAVRPQTRDFDEPQHNALQGAYFPAAPLGQAAASLGDPGATARIRIAIEALRGQEIDEGTVAEIQTALRLWLILGGVGSRTRRGAGAIALRTEKAARDLGVPANVGELEAFLRSLCTQAGSPHPGVFSLARTIQVLVGSAAATGERAQVNLLETLRETRQDRVHPAGWRGANGWGRTRWPEADAIRLKVNSTQTWRHDPDVRNAGRYPRAALGLPIVFHYQPPNEPPNQTVTAVRRGDRSRITRYSSPIVLRPVRLWMAGREQAVPIALFTACTLPTDALAVVESTAGQGAAQQPVQARDLTPFEIQPEAATTLARVMLPFLAPTRGFRALLP
jgi:CRISPR-associated protein Cmr1